MRSTRARHRTYGLIYWNSVANTPVRAVVVAKRPQYASWDMKRSVDNLEHMYLKSVCTHRFIDGAKKMSVDKLIYLVDFGEYVLKPRTQERPCVSRNQTK